LSFFLAQILWGAGIDYQKPITGNLRLGANLDYWSQPYMVLGGQRLYTTNTGAGGRLLAKMNLFFNDSFPIGVSSEVGYKSSGFKEGERLDEGIILRLGLSIRSRDRSPSLPETSMN